MSTRIKIKGMTRIRQKPSISHLLKEARRNFERSKSVGAKGFPVALSAEGMALMSVFIGLLDPLDDEVGGDVDRAGDHEKNDAENKQDTIMVITERGLTHFRGDGGSNRAYGVRKHLRNAVVMACREQDGHGFADRASHAEHAGSQESVASSREKNAAHCLPRIGAEGQGSLAKGVRHGSQGIFSQRNDHRNAHEGQNDAAGEQIGALSCAGFSSGQMQ